MLSTIATIHYSIGYVHEIRHEKEMEYKDCKGHKKMVVLYR